MTEFISQFKVVKNVSVNETAKQFPDLLFLPFLKKIIRGKIQGHFISVFTIYKDNPVALAITELRNNKTAELHSVFTKKEFRRKGLAENIIRFTDNMLTKNQIKYTDIVYSDIYKEKEIIDKLIHKTGYLQPKITTQNIKLNIKNVLKSSWTEESLKKEKDIEIYDFAELSETDKKDILKMQNAGKFPIYLRPFQMTDYINTKISKIAKYKNKIAGWCILHTVNKETLQCSALFVFEEYREKFISKKLMAAAFSDMTNIKYTVYQIKYDDKFIINYLNKLFSENNAIKNTFHTIASRKYYN